MFKIKEVVGSSPLGYSEAVKETIEKVLKAGQIVHFFQVLEQRGLIQEGKLKEFQVSLRVAIETPDEQ